MKKMKKIIAAALVFSMLSGCAKDSAATDKKKEGEEITEVPEISAAEQESNTTKKSEPTQESDPAKEARPTAESSAAGENDTAGEEESTQESDTSETVVQTQRQAPKSVEEVQPYTWCTFPPENDLTACDFSKDKELLSTLCFTNYTQFPEKDKMPQDISMEELLEWGKYPGLHMDVLYKHGLTGKNAVAAIIDQPMPTDHEAFKGMKIIYHDLVKGAGADNSMHGACVASLFSARGIGTAPDATLHFIEDASWEEDYQNTADAIYEILETNKSLSENEKINMFSDSNYIGREDNKNEDKLLEAIDAAEKAGVWVWMCNYPLKMNDGAFTAFSDKDDPNSVHKAVYSNATPWTDISWENVLTIPAGGRTTAYTVLNRKDEYAYWSDGGVSWSAPYLCGLAATARSIAPDLTQAEVCDLFLSTADSVNDLNVISPVRFMAKVLRHSGDDQLADTILKEAGISE